MAGDEDRSNQADTSDLRPIERSATIVLLRETDPSIDVLMVQRASTMGFAAQALVFPGGKVDTHDTRAPWRDGVEKIHFALQGFEPQEHDVRVAAIRELFEECGILLAYRDGQLVDTAQLNISATDLLTLRAQINDDASLFAPFLKDQRLTPAFDQLTLFARWQTPPLIKRRFDTWFFLAAMPQGQTAIADGVESCAAFWAPPAVFLDRANKGEAKVIFPTARNLELLARHQSFEAARRDAHNRTIETIIPVMVEDNGEKFLTIPEHLGYPVTREHLEKALRG